MNKSNYDERNICHSSINKFLDSNKSTIDINSNFQMKFKLCNCIQLPSSSKIEILETKLSYNLFKIEKDILINGHETYSNNISFLDTFILKNSYFNLPNGNHNKISININENIKLKISIKLEIRAIAHKENYEDIFIEASGNTDDNIESIIMTSLCIPNYKYCLEKTFLELENTLSAIVNPNFVFLSPIYDCNSNINSFLGNIFINYTLGVNALCYMKQNKTNPKYNHKSSVIFLKYN